MHLLAQATNPTQLTPREVLRSISGQYRSHNGDYLPVQLVVIAGLAACLLLLWWRQRDTGDGAAKVFRQLSGEMSLRRRERRLLTRIARQQALPSPLTLLLSPSTLRHHGEQFVRHWSRADQARMLGRIASLRRRAFPSA